MANVKSAKGSFKGLAAVAGVSMLVGCGNPPTGEATDRDCANDFPDREIEVIVPFSPGGSMDTAARQVAEVWPDHLGVPVTITNMEGSGGQQAFSHIFNDDDEGHRVLASVEPYLSVAVMGGQSDYDFDDFSFINLHEFDPATIVVSEDSPYETLQDLIDDSRERPGEITYSTLAGGAVQLVPRMLAEQLDLEWREVTYPGGEETRNAALSGETDFGTSTTSGDIPMEGELRVLGMATDEPVGQAEALPSINEELVDEGTDLPDLGSSRFFASLTSFKDSCPDQFDTLVDSYEATLEDERYLELLGDRQENVTFEGPEESEATLNEMYEVNQEYSDLLLGEE